MKHDLSLSLKEILLLSKKTFLPFPQKHNIKFIPQLLKLMEKLTIKDFPFSIYSTKVIFFLKKKNLF